MVILGFFWMMYYCGVIGKSIFKDLANRIRSLGYFLWPIGLSIRAIKVCTFSFGVSWLISSGVIFGWVLESWFEVQMS